MMKERLWTIVIGDDDIDTPARVIRAGFPRDYRVERVRHFARLLCGPDEKLIRVSREAGE